MLRVEEAQEKILNAVTTLASEKTEVGAALRRVLAQDIASPCDVPPFDNSAMDGFALRAEDTLKATAQEPAILNIKGAIRAGDASRLGIGSGECVRIMTGATIPRGADSVVMIEDVRVEGERMFLASPISEGDHVRSKGEDIRRSELLLQSGTLLRPQELGVLASLGITEVVVTRRPIVALLTTGDELVGIDRPLPPGKIRDSNRYSLRGLILDLGCTPLELGIVPDRYEEMVRVFIEALESSDAVMSTGGVSMGQYDLVRKVLSQIGRIEFWRVNMKPGKPLTFAIGGGKPIFGLPGNPVSCVVSFELFARPALMKMMGRRDLFKDELIARAVSPIDKRSGRTEFKRGRMWRQGRALAVDLTGPQGSGILTSLVRANCLIHLEEDRGSVSPGDEVSVIPL